MDTVTLLGYIAGGLTTLSLLPQVIKTWRSKSVGDISMGMFIVFCLGISLWVVYGFAIGSMPVIAANIVSLFLGMTMLWLRIKHR